MTIEYSLRDVRNDEIEWLYKLNKESYRDVVVRQFGDWNETFQREMFHAKWRRIHAAKIVLEGDNPIGVVVLEQRESYDWLREILLKAEHRDQGIGTSLMQRFIADARARQCPLRLQVLHENNRAKKLYERLGFVVIETLENHFLMEVG